MSENRYTKDSSGVVHVVRLNEDHHRNRASASMYLRCRPMIAYSVEIPTITWLETGPTCVWCISHTRFK